MLIAAGCGGDSGDAGDSGGGEEAAPTTTSAPSDDGGSADAGTTPTTAASQGDGETSDGGGSGAASGIGTASVTLNGETYLFGETSFPALRCDPDMFGIFWVLLMRVDEAGNEIPSGGSLDLELVQEGAQVDETNTAELKITDLDQEWVANPDDIELLGLDPGTSQIDSFTIDGNTVSGTATFYESNSYYAAVGGTADEVAVAQGTFEATCSEG